MKLSDEAEFTKHCERLGAMGAAAFIEITFQPATAIAVLAELQLALRHPGNVGESAKAARKVVDTLIGALDAMSPGIGRLLRKGDDPNCDVPTGEKAGAV